jgi:hypothetical protein
MLWPSTLKYYITVCYIMQVRDQFKESDIGRSYSTHVRMRNAYKGLDGKPERMRPLGRHLWRWIF